MGGLQQYYPGLHAIVACWIKVYCLVGVVFLLAQRMILQSRHVQCMRSHLYKADFFTWRPSQSSHKFVEVAFILQIYLV